MSEKDPKKTTSAPKKQAQPAKAERPEVAAKPATKPATKREKKREAAKKQREQKVEQVKKRLHKVSPARWIVLLIMLAITVLSYVFYEPLFSTDPNVSWFLDPNSIDPTDPDSVATPNTGSLFLDDVIMLVPTVIKCIQSVTIILVIVTILSLIVRKAFGITQRGLTISSLVCNLINWLTAVILIIVILSAFGVDTTALITGAGVVTLIIGLGMQSLIADIVAGLFIVFENEFNVGDWVTVGDFRGEVISIGIRTTKLKAVGNVKIINNSDLRGVINHDTDTSVAKTLIDVEYGAKLPEVEKIIKKHVGKLKVEHATDAVSYDGVASLGASGVTLQFTCHCKEADIFAAGRELNFAVKNMFDENGIDIPFPQIVIHK